MAKKPWIVPIPGTTKGHRLTENIGSVDLALTLEDLDSIERAAASVPVQGARFPDHYERMTGL